ncbi:hypothetical protein N7470_009286 [Penicillium chermesinum]|nr:hypothetical protein N7470_009286 [Penicillium chermesinum]
MQSGNLESRFCSPFLVNAILADACAYSEYPEAYAVSSHLWSRGLHFYKEAKRLLDEATGKVSVAFLQGLGVLYVVTCMVGKDRNGWVYLHQMANGVDELAQKHKLPGRNADEETRRDARAVESMIWGLFNLASMTAVAFQKGSPVKVPHMPRYLSQRDPHRDKWSNYPIKAENTESHTQCLFDAFCDLSLITHDLSWSVLDGKRQTLTTDLVGMIENAYKRLRGWYEGLPSCLETESATPHVLSFHLMYQTIIQTLFGLMRNLPAKEDSDDRSEVESEIEDESEPDWKTRARQRAQQICLEAARESGRLADLNRDLWGSNNVPPVNVHWVTVAMFTLLSELDEKENSDAFVSLCVAAKSNANLWALGKGTLRLVQVTAKQMEVTLPPETDALFIDFETRFWSAEDRKVFNSQYPNYGLTMKRAERDEIELDAFLAKFDDLYVTEVAENESTRELLHSPGSSAAGDEIQGASSVER